MKNLLSVTKKATVFFMITIIMATMFSVSFFATDSVKINGESFNVGETITYTAVFKCDKICSGVTATVNYDDSALELDKKSVNIPNLGLLAISNVDNPGVVKFIGIDVVKGFDFTNGDLLVSMSFKIKDSAKDNDIKLELSELTDIDTNIIQPDSCTVEESVQKGTYDGEVATLGNGDELMKQDQENKENNQTQQSQPKKLDKTTGVWIIVVVLIAVAVVVTVICKILKNKKGKNADVSANEWYRTNSVDTEM